MNVSTFWDVECGFVHVTTRGVLYLEPHILLYKLVFVLFTIEMVMWKFLRSDAVAVLKDKRAQESLGRYFAVMRDEKPAKFMVAKKLSAEFNEKDSLEKLWQKHARLTEEFCKI